MLNPETIKSDFSYIEPLTGTGENYHGSVNFPGNGESCDLYFGSSNKIITEKQVVIFNNFKSNFKTHLPIIEQAISDSLNSSEANKRNEIKISTLYFEVIEVPQNNPKYDLVLVCGKTYTKWLFFKKEITMRIEFLNGRIQSIKRTKDSITDND